MSFTPTDYEALLTQLDSLRDERYRLFNEKLIPGKQNATLGVRMPLLRGVARQLCRGDWRAFLDCEAVRQSTLHEMVLLAGIVTAIAPCSTAERLELTAAFLPRVQDWAVCDTVCASYRIPPADRPVWQEFLRPYLTCGQEFAERFALVLLMDRFLDKDCTDADAAFVLQACALARCPAYYTRMAAAWALCTCFCRRPEQTERFLCSTAGQGLDGTVWDLFLRKCRESRLVSPADAARLAALRPHAAP